MGKVYTALYEYNGLALLPLNLSEQFFSRVANFNGSKQALVIQEQGDPDKPYFGAVYTASIRQGKIVKGDKIKLPHGVSLYGFNLFKGQGNERLIVAYDSDGYIVVYDGALNSIWKSTEKYGLSQLAFKIRDLDYINQTGKEYRTYFVNQRLIVTKKQTILAGYNDSTRLCLARLRKR